MSVGTSSSSMYVKVKGALAKIIQFRTRDHSLLSTGESRTTTASIALERAPFKNYIKLN